MRFPWKPFLRPHSRQKVQFPACSILHYLQRLAVECIDPNTDCPRQASPAPRTIYKVPLPSLGLDPRLPALLGAADMKESQLLITHVINPTSSLIELWLCFAALVLFTLGVTELNYWNTSLLSAGFYWPIQGWVTELCSFLASTFFLLQLFFFSCPLPDISSNPSS